jgi:vacuolar-type H+-ATPase subunit F/Vma7
MSEIFRKDKLVKILKKKYSEIPDDWYKNRDFFKEKSLSILSYDVDSIKNYVFGSSEFKAIIGASKIVSNFDEMMKKELSSKNTYIVHAVGGTGLIILLRDDVEEIEKIIKNTFNKNVPGGYVTVSSVDFYPYELINGLEKQNVNERDLESKFNLKFNNLTEQTNFYKLFSLLASNMREKKNSKEVEMKRITPEFHICESCNTYPATQVLRKPSDSNENENIKICESCAKKIEVGKKKISEEKFAKTILEIDTEIEEEKMSDWLGVIYIDGNNLGKLYSKIDSDEEYIRISDEIDKASQNAVKQLIESMNLEGKYAAPILGGDDIMLFIPSNIAIEAYIELDKILNKEFGKIGKDGISYCGSILFCKKSMPLKMIFDSSSALLKQAKSEFYNNYKKSEKEKNYIATRVLWGNNTEVKSEEFFGPENNIKEYFSEGMEFSYFKEYFEIIKNLEDKEEKFLFKAAKIMNDVIPVVKLNLNYFYYKNLKKSNKFKELYEKIFFPKENTTRVLSTIDLLKFINKGGR